MAARRDEDDEVRAPLRSNFAQALRHVLELQKVTWRELQARCGWTSHSKLNKWLQAETEPPPHVVFQIEEALGLPPGMLSRHLEYLPLDINVAELPDVTFEVALERNVVLSDQAKRIIRNIVAEFSPSPFTPLEEKAPSRRRR